MEVHADGRVKALKKVNGFIALARPFTLIAPAVGVFAGVLMALAYYDNFAWGASHFLLLFGSAVLFSMINTASNAYNQVYDADNDMVNKPARPIPAGIITKNEALYFSIFLYLLAFLVAFFIGTFFFIFTSLFILITLLYSAPPIRLKDKLWVANISIAVARSWLLLLAGWSIFPGADPFAPSIWFVGFILFVFLLGTASTKDFTDMEGDRKFGARTLPVVYGPAKSARIIAPFFVIPFALIPLGVILGYVSSLSIMLVPLAVWGVWVATHLRTAADNPAQSFENSPVWVHMYLMLMALQAGFCTVFII